MRRKKNKRDEFLSLVPGGVKKVLDVGCGRGDLGLKLKAKDREVVGVEKDEACYNIAREKLNKTFLSDIEKFQLPYPQKYFDCILYADILEHLINPFITLRGHRKYLNDTGFIIASIPNIRYYKVIARLVLGGTWDYMDKGILDRSHLRFFTLINIQELFVRAGYEIVEIRRNVIAARGIKILNYVCFNGLKEFLTYQYYVKAKKLKNEEEPSIKKRKIYQF